MAKIRHNNILDTVDSVLSVSKKKGIIHLHAEDQALTGQHLTLNSKKVLHFGTCGYLGLEHHPAVKRGAIEAIERFGTQFPMSRTYVSNPLYRELEDLIQQMYQVPAVISKNCTLSHLTTIPSIIRQSDLVILDHQVHASVQEAVKKLLSQGVTVEMIRHNNLEMLEDRIQKQRGKYERIWYMADSVYSMYGDFAPIKEMIALAEKYEQLYLYVDDAHGMSWAGKNGAGYAMSQMPEGLYRKMILTANLGKAFGACGGLSLFPNQAWYDKVNNFGGPLTFSVQIEPATLGAAIASAKIHLSGEIYAYQEELQKRIAYFNQLLRQTDLPLVHECESPIFFIGTGTMDMGNHLVQALLNDGIYVNLATFPAVPAKNIGVRITISLNNTYEDIEELVHKLKIHFDGALTATSQTQHNIRKAFRIPALSVLPAAPVPVANTALAVRRAATIEEVDAAEWNRCLGNRGMFDWNGMRFLEESFRGNAERESNWGFRYYAVEDPQGQTVLMTFAMSGLVKEDMFSQASISRAIEKEREANPYYLTSTGIVLGSLFTEGNHLFLDRESPYWKQALKALLAELAKEQEQEGAGSILLRDLDAHDPEMDEFMVEHDFVKLDLPESCVVENLGWSTEEEFRRTLSKKGRENFVQKIKRYERCFKVQVKSCLSDEELEHAMALFRNVKSNNYAINNFLFPEKLFHLLNKNESWEFVLLYIDEAYALNPKPVSVAFCHKNAATVYSFMLVGMDYDYLLEYNVYRQTLYQVIKRANALGCKKVNFGISATMEKKKVGATPYPKVGYYQAKDNFAMEMIGATFAVEKE
ncbi:bifunctional aminotransferase class I/II-fold pyridoxal phosphate-dependent enzyme/GNAT family N-acetyltransferase [Pontibacter litorisediminis]|uniref:bifunctional aminotransferase class I/II-fold pyridoxal phosphate-dependent enzyme/GNAT family N-acetyltransferase n=1 Tax=Pontibacter litorisediminis TaxID=1846260 RepID=UPI0023EB9F31|nr:bifunctional aminotransferase class I/II-fold pyridoxal phosphate-dependent enzyme/GNAT family N-acetyltransferase [Pontibacter litorisediminis]